MHGADVDNLAWTAGGFALLDEGLRGEEHTLQVDVQHCIEIAFGDVPERRVLFDAGVVDQHVEPTQRLGTARDEVAYFRHSSKIGLDDRATPPERLYLGQRFFGAAGVAVVVDDDVGALFGETNGNAAANPLAAAGDEHLATKEAIAARSDRRGER